MTLARIGRASALPLACTIAALGLTACAVPPVGWTTPGGDLANTRHSPLRQITSDNVAQLVPAWRFDTGAPRGQEGGALVVGDTLFLHTPFPNRVFALALADQRLRWTYSPTQSAEVPSLMCCDVVSRGLAQADGRVFVQLADTSLVALDARTGRELWRVANGDPRRGETASNAPLVVHPPRSSGVGTLVLTGIAGGEYGVRGHLSAYDAASGHLVWRGYNTGPDDELLADPATTMTWRDGRMQPVGADASLGSWQGAQWRQGGGTTWGWFAADEALGLVFHGTGNPGTWNPVQRPGDNRWSNALMARDLATGRLRWVLQLTPHDEWDYDGVNEPILFDAPDPARAEGPPRRLLAHFDRNGFAYLLERASGALLRADKFEPSTNWASHVDLAHGRPVVDPRRSPQAQGEDVRTDGICPAAIGAKNQAPAAYDPARGLFFVPMLRLCMDFEPFQVDYTAGQPYVGASYTLHPAPGADDQLGALLAWDPLEGRAAWTVPEPWPLWGGVLSTASGLVFYGTLDGHLKAVDAGSGRLRWTSPPLPAGVVGNVHSWAWQGRQYVGVLTGAGGLAADPEGIGKLRGDERPGSPPPVSPGAFVVFALPEPSP